MSILNQAIRLDKEYRALLHTAELAFAAVKPLKIAASGLCDGAADAAYVSLIEDLKRRREEGARGLSDARAALIVCAEEKDCVRTCDMLSRFGLRAVFFGARDLNFHNITASHDYEHERLEVLFGLRQGTLDIVLTTPDAALGYTIPTERLDRAVLHLDFSTRVEPSVLAARLVSAGYARVDMVDGKGQFAVRGGIVDIYPTGGVCVDADGVVHEQPSPIRIELFDDEIDRMGLFDIETQRIHTSVLEVTLPPAVELLPDEDAMKSLQKVLASQLKGSLEDSARELLRKEAATLEAALAGSGDIPYADKYISLFYPEKSCLLDYFTTRTTAMIVGTAAMHERLKGALWHADQTVKDMLESGTIAAKYAEYTHRAPTLDAFLEKQVTLHVDSMSYGLSGQRLSGMFGFRSKQMVSFGENYDLLFEDLNSYLDRKYKVFLLAENETAAKNLCGLLQEKDYRAHVEGENASCRAGEICVVWREYLQGFELVSPRIAVLSTAPQTRAGNVAASGKIKSKKKKKDTASKAILSYAELEIGDLVVHEDYGIGRYTGIETLNTAGSTRDYIGIQYAGSDKLFLPTEKLAPRHPTPSPCSR